jgi:hypothetical protein
MNIKAENRTLIECPVYNSTTGITTLRNWTIVSIDTLDNSAFGDYIAVSATVNTFFLLGLASFVWFRKSEIISQRVPSLVYLTALCCILFTNFQLFLISDFQFIYAEIPCFVEAWIAFLLIPVWQACYFLRALYVVANYRLNQLILSPSHQARTAKDLAPEIRFLMVFRRLIIRLKGSAKLFNPLLKPMSAVSTAQRVLKETPHMKAMSTAPHSENVSNS